MSKLNTFILTTICLLCLVSLMLTTSHANESDEFRRLPQNWMLEKITKTPSDNVQLISLEPGTYLFEDNCLKKTLYISNHDQTNPKSVGIYLENQQNLIIDGNGSLLLFHGRHLPIALINCQNITLRNFRIDVLDPQIIQMTVLENNPEKKYLILQPAPWVRYTLNNRKFIAHGKDWSLTPQSGMAFEPDTRHILSGTCDFYVNLSDMESITLPNGTSALKANNWHAPLLKKGTILALRTYQRPHPGIFLSECKDIKLQNITIHYAEGMGLLAQMSENITLSDFKVCLKDKQDPRYFTTQADATHFSGCKGKIISENGYYEGMMDDAINVHGTYLKVEKIINPRTIHARYMHVQTWGFKWGEPGDDLQFIKSQTMEYHHKNQIHSITPLDTPTEQGAKLFEITLKEALPNEIMQSNENWGIENLTWTPEVVFNNNYIRNNRARGALFSTPKCTRVENNTFDHTSGTAILLCGDCNGWYETGACREILIRNNRFINALTNYYQFTNAIISIYPEIPNLTHQTAYFHGQGQDSIVIENNLFATFDKPILYAKSCDGITFRNNSILKTDDFIPFHHIKHGFFFEFVKNVKIYDNKFYPGFDIKKEIRCDQRSADFIDIKNQK